MIHLQYELLLHYMIYSILRLIRVKQWIKNVSLYAAIIFAGHLFDTEYFILTTKGFIIFCIISSASYIINDIVDAPLDRKHPIKKKRPIASGAVPVELGWILFIIFSLVSLAGAMTLGFAFFAITVLFYGLHLAYTLKFKQHAVLDILLIASSFLLRVFAGEVLTGLHIPIWLMFSVIFLSLFIASCKRRAELVHTGKSSRPALEHYRIQLLDFYNSTFATGTIIAYALFSFEVKTVYSNPIFNEFLQFTFPALVGRKWIMATTLPLIIIGIMRYAQLIYEGKEGEAPERIVTSDKILIGTIALWGFAVILFTYVLN